MNARACALLLAVIPLTTGAGITTRVTLDVKGRGEVFIVSETSLDEAKRLEAVADPRLRDSLLVRQMLAPPLEVSRLLTRQGFSEVAVRQYTKENLRTEVTARISDVRPLTACCGGELTFSRKPGDFLELNGTLGGALAGQDVDLAPLKNLHVTLRIDFPGSVCDDTDNAARASHIGNSVAYGWPADRLLAGPTPVHVRIVPDIEGTPYFWLALILGVTALVVVGAFIVLRHGREAMAAPGE